MKYRFNQDVTLCFTMASGEYAQHCMSARAALLMARDIKARYPDAEVYPVDQFGRRTTSKPITFADLEI